MIHVSFSERSMNEACGCSERSRRVHARKREEGAGNWEVDGNREVDWGTRVNHVLLSSLPVGAHGSEEEHVENGERRAS